jgi:histidinol dehydrogenase
MAIILNAKSSNFEDKFNTIIGRKRSGEENVRNSVVSIINDVRAHGDKAVLSYTNKFDRVNFKLDDMIVSKDEIEAGYNRCYSNLLEALKLAAKRIKAYHQEQRPKNVSFTDDLGVKLGYKWKPVKSAGLYVPGGTAAYPSSVLMNAIPAKVAGVERLVMAVPAPDNKLNPLVLAAAKIVGVDEVYKVGGAQAIAAMAYGTETILPVDVIVGPGNSYVAEAKRQVFGKVGIDMIAGPSEILVVADKDNNPEWIAVDLLSQAEHDPSAQSILITDNLQFAERVVEKLQKKVATLPRKEIALESWNKNGLVIVVDDFEQAIPIIDEIAPEHLELCIEDAESFVDKVSNAGAIFVGNYTPEAIGDYVGGTNHVLPTSGSAKFSSALGVFNFMKRTSILQCNQENIKQIGPAAVTLADAEGLDAHGLSVKLRL